MNAWHPSLFFDISSDFHPKLFEGVEHVWEILNSLQDYLQQLPLGEKESDIPEGVFVEKSELITLCEGVVIEPGAFLRGPCYIGPHTTIRHGAYVRGGVITGEKCIIGHASEVKNSIFLNGASAPHFAYVGDSILGQRCNLGAGTRLANLRLDGKEITTCYQGGRMETGRRKLGSIIGDDAQVGCNVVMNPGTFLRPRVKCYPSLNIGGYIEADFVLKSQTLKGLVK